MTEAPRVRPNTSDMPRVQGFRRSSNPCVLSRGTPGDVISALRGCTSHPAPDARHTLPMGATHLSISRCHS